MTSGGRLLVAAGPRHGGAEQVYRRRSSARVPACVVLLLLATTRFAYASDSFVDMAQTLIHGMDHRANLLKTFEAVISVIDYEGGASDARSDEQQYAPRSVEVRYYAADRAARRWLVERRECLPEHAVEGRGQPWVTYAFVQGIKGSKTEPDDHWSVHGSPRDERYGRDVLGLTSHVLLLLSYATYSWYDSFARETVTGISEEEIDGARCLRIDARRTLSRTPRSVFRSVTWVDTERGFAVRKWVHLYIMDGRLTLEHVGRALELHQYEDDLWLPEGAVVARYRHDRQRGRRIEELWTCRTLCAAVNKPIEQDYWSEIAVDQEFCPADYEPRLVDEAVISECITGDTETEAESGPGDVAAVIGTTPEIAQPRAE